MQSDARSVTSATEGSPSARRACNQCRRRKIRCDRDWPCSNCRMIKHTCTYAGVGQRPQVPRQRVPDSSQYETQMDHIQNRLGSIEAFLKGIPVSLMPPNLGDNIQPPAAESIGSIPGAASNIDLESSDEEPAFAGDSGLTAQTTFANDFLEKAVQKTSLHDCNPRMEAALANLRSLVESHQQRSISHGPRFPLQASIPPGGICKSPMPPWSAVAALLKRSKDSPFNLFNIFSSLVAITDFPSLCYQIYSTKGDCSIAVFTIVNALLHKLFVEYHAQVTDPIVRDEYRVYMQQCRVNLETSLANTPLFLPGKPEDIQALLLGVFYAVDVSRPLLSWELNSMAVQLCQTAGYHRIETLRHDPPAIANLKSALFWSSYNLDASLSLRLCRAPVINECDVNIPRVFGMDSFGLQSSDIPAFWVKIATLQRRIYEQLYSPAAAVLPQSQLANRARMLAEDCRALEVETEENRKQINQHLEAANSSGIADMILRGHEAQFHVTFALVYQIIPVPENAGGRFTDECLCAARKAMQIHQECSKLQDPGNYLRSIYIHWTFLLTPFSPFFVLFCHIIETSSLTDLKLLEDFVSFLNGCREFSDTIEKLYLLTQVMVDIAGLYLEAKSGQQDGLAMTSIGDEFEMYLNQLDHTMAYTADSQWTPSVDRQGRHVADWFMGNRDMMGLREEESAYGDI